MDGRISMYVLLVCVWCSLDAGVLLMVVTAQPTASAVILTPEADRKEGGQVYMRCVATNLESDHMIVDWETRNPTFTLRWNDSTITTNRRFMFTTTYPRRGEVVQNFTITDLQIDDYDQYFCYVKLPNGGGHLIVAASSVILSPPSYPICSPSGPITVNTGTELPLRCLSETDNPAVIMATHPMTDPRNYPWTSSSVDGTDTLSLNLTVTDDGVAFNCSVLGSGADTMTRSCIIGPISVTISEDATDGISSVSTTLTTEATPTTSSNDQQPPCSQWVVSFVVTFILFVVSIIVIIIGAFQVFKMRRLINSLTSTKASQVPKADPYMELQQTEDKNRVYMEPTTATTTTQDTYYQPVEVENDNPEYIELN